MYICILCHFILNNVKIVILYCTLYDLYTNEMELFQIKLLHLYVKHVHACLILPAFQILLYYNNVNKYKNIFNYNIIRDTICSYYDIIKV